MTQSRELSRRKNRKEFRGQALAFFCALLIIVLSYLYLDRPLAYAARDFPPAAHELFEILQLFCDTTVNLTLWFSTFFFVQAFTKKNETAQHLLLIGTPVAVANLFSFFIKIFVSRARPELFFNESLYGFFFFKSGFLYESFPSGHAVTIGAVVGALACLFPRYRALLFILAFILAFSRVVTGFHFLSDVFGGLFLGIVIAQWCIYKLKLKLDLEKRL